MRVFAQSADICGRVFAGVIQSLRSAPHHFNTLIRKLSSGDALDRWTGL